MGNALAIRDAISKLGGSISQKHVQRISLALTLIALGKEGVTRQQLLELADVERRLIARLIIRLRQLRFSYLFFYI